MWWGKANLLGLLLKAGARVVPRQSIRPTTEPGHAVEAGGPSGAESAKGQGSGAALNHQLVAAYRCYPRLTMSTSPRRYASTSTAFSASSRLALRVRSSTSRVSSITTSAAVATASST